MNEDARDNFEEDDFEEAVARFRKMVKNNTSNYFDVYEVEGIVDQLLDDGRIKLARKAVETGLRLHPTSVSIKIRQAQVLMHEGKLEECLELLSIAEKIEKNNPDLLLVKGRALNLLGDVGKAVAAFDTALQMPIDDLDETLYNIGISFGLAGETHLAIKYLEKACKANPRNEIVLYELGYYFDKDSQFENSIEYYDKYLNIDPFNHSVWYNIGITYNRMGMFEKAIQAYDYAIVLNEGFLHAHFNKANALANNNQFDEAIECYLEYLLLDKENDDAYCYLAECYLNSDRYSDALINYQHAIRLNDANSSAWYGSGLIMWSEGQLLESQPFFKKAISLEEDNSDFWAMDAKVHAELDEIKEAIESFEMATMLEPENIENWLSYSEMFYDMDDTDKAIEVLKTASKFNKSDAYLSYRLTAYLLDKNEELEAACHFEKALKIDYSKQNELFEFYPEASKIESIKKLISQYQTTKL
ncbi:MAG: tetratricopeptide repeat protein [Bacteroidota bacterium]|nr:tetratricopeptide repeat protein [Bacteroidota bacterium]